MTDTATIAGSVPAQPGELNIVCADDTVPGTPLYHSSGEGVAARANAAGTARVVALAMGAGAEGHRVRAAFSKAIPLTTAEWDVITGQSGGLTEGAQYYLSAAAAGKLVTTIATTPNYVTPIGRALSSTAMLVQIQAAVLGLGS